MRQVLEDFARSLAWCYSSLVVVSTTTPALSIRTVAGAGVVRSSPLLLHAVSADRVTARKSMVFIRSASG